MSFTKRKCDVCDKEYYADNRNLRRGWGLCCSKSCASKKREMSKSTYDPKRVKMNNIKRELWNYKPSKSKQECEWEDIENEWDLWADNDQWGDFDIGCKD